MESPAADTLARLPRDPFADPLARRLRALAEPMRLKLMDELRGGEMTVQQLTAALRTSQQNTSKHLTVLHRAGFVRRRKSGVYAYYSVADASIFALLEFVRRGSMASTPGSSPHAPPAVE